MCHYEVAPSNTAVCSEGEKGDKVYIILSGEAKVDAFITEKDINDHEESVSRNGSPVFNRHSLAADEAAPAKEAVTADKDPPNSTRVRRGSLLKAEVSRLTQENKIYKQTNT